MTFRPVASEESLIYLEWVNANRARVDRLSDGRIGYLHIPDMGGDGLREFIKWFYPQLGKEGLIVDVRANGGGFVSPLILDRLRRELLTVDIKRTRDVPYPPETGTASLTGEWIIEGPGVDPDIVVENDPKSLIEGRDPQLERGVEEVLKTLREKPRARPTRPAAPVKTE